MRYFAVALVVIAVHAAAFGARLWLPSGEAGEWEDWCVWVSLWGAYMLWRFARDDAPPDPDNERGWHVKFRGREQVER